MLNLIYTCSSFRLKARNLTLAFLVTCFYISVCGVFLPLQAQSTLSIIEKYNEAERALFLNEYDRSNSILNEIIDRLCADDQYAEECAQSYLYLAAIERNNRNFEAVKENLDRAEKTIEERLEREHPIIVNLYIQYGYYYEEMSDLEQGEESIRKAVEAVNRNEWKEKPKAQAYLALGYIEDSNGNYQEAVDAYNEALFAVEGIERDEEILKILSQAYNNIGIAYRRLGKVAQAMSHYQLALQVARETFGENHPELGFAYNSIGTVYYTNGDYATAADYFLKSSDIFQNAYGENNDRVAGALNNTGLTYFKLKDYDNATKYLERAQRIKENVLGNEHPDTAIGYSNLAAIHLENDNYEAAERNYQRSLDVRRKNFGNEHPSLIDPLIQLGKLYIDKSEYTESRRYFRNALEISEKRLGRIHPDVADAYYEIGNSYAGEKKYQEAAEYYNFALEILTENDFDPNKNRYEVADILEPMLFVNVLRAFGNTILDRYPDGVSLAELETGLNMYMQSSEMIDQLQTSYESESSKLNLVDENYSVYTNAIEVLFILYQNTGEDRYIDEMLSIAERSKSRVALELFQELEAKNVSGVPQEVLDKEKDLQEEINDFYQNLHFEQEKGLESDDQLVAAFRDSLFRAQRSLENFTRELENDYPSYYILKYDRNLADVESIRELLNDNETMLIYIVGESRVFALTIDQQEMDVHDLGPIDNLANRVETLRAAVLAGNTQLYTSEAYSFYQQLIEPVKNSLSGNELIIIPDQALSYLPFEMLLQSSAESLDYYQYPYLIKEYQVKYAPSATMLGIMMAQKPNSPRNLLAMAPYPSSTIQVNESSSGIERYLLNLTPLPLTRYETREISNLFNEKNSWWNFTNREKIEVLIDREATSDRLMNGAVEEYGFIHFATHAFVHESNPSLSGIALRGTGNQDGIIYVNDIYNLKMNADLVVLGACETGLGSIYRGEGLIGFTRAFIYAGAANLVVSMWRVNDQPTANLMVEFYRLIQEGNSYAESLQKAKLKLIDHPETAAPRNWAAFILNGR